MLRTYFITLIIFSVLAVLMMVPPAPVLVIMFTAGLGFPLIFSATAVAYLICFFPLALLWNNGTSSRLVGTFLSIFAVAVLAIIPGLEQRQTTKHYAAVLASKDIQPEKLVRARTIEIRRKRSNYARLFSGQKPCAKECRALLLSGRVDWIRVVMTEKRRKKTSQTGFPSTFHVARSGAACAILGTSAESSNKCILPANDPGSAAELIIKFEDGYRRNVPPPAATKSPNLIKWRRVTAILNNTARPEPVLMQTEAEMRTIAIPTILGPKFVGMNSRGVDALTLNKRHNSISLISSLQALGYPLDKSPKKIPLIRRKRHSWKDGVTPIMTRELIAVLDLSTVAPFNREQSRVISNWVSHARSIKLWTPELKAILRRIVRDQRIRRSTNVNQILSRNAALAREFLPDVLDMIETDGIGRDYTVARKTAYTFVNYDPEMLKPHTDRFTGLIRNGDQKTREILTRAIGRFGIDPLPYIAPIENDLQAREHFPRLKGACFAEQRWAASLIPHVRAALATATTKKARRKNFASAIFRTLIKLGDVDFVNAEIASGRYGDMSRFTKRVRRFRKRLCHF